MSIGAARPLRAAGVDARGPAVVLRVGDPPKTGDGPAAHGGPRDSGGGGRAGGAAPPSARPAARAGRPPGGLALTPDGRFLFVAHTGSRDIVPLSIGPQGEPVAATAPFDIDGIPDALVVTPDGRFLLASLPFLARVAVLEIAADGGLRQAPGSPFRADANSADGMALGRGGALLYAADANTTALLLSSYRLGPQGRLERVGGSPFAAPGGPANILHLMNGGRALVGRPPRPDAAPPVSPGPPGGPPP